MLIKIKKSFEEGLDKIRWFSGVVTERLRIEIAVVKLMWESADLEKKRSAINASIGERVFELRARTELNLLQDKKIMDAVREIEKLEEEIKVLKIRASELAAVQ